MPNPPETVMEKRAARRQAPPYKTVAEYVEAVCREDAHARQVLSLSNAVFGVIHAAAVGIHAIGAGLAEGLSLTRKHAVKQVDRLLSNTRLSDEALQAAWVRRSVGAAKRIVVALDWTDFDADGHTTLVLALAGSGRHGRAVPLVWQSVKKSEVAGRRNELEYALLERFEAALPDEVYVTVLADRGFGDQKLYVVLQRLSFDYVIRFRGIIKVKSAEGETRAAQDWLAPDGRSRKMSNVGVTDDATLVKAFVSAHHKGMAEAWFLASSRDDLIASDIVALYGRRFTIEEQFRDTKDNRFGLGLSYVSIGTCARRDRLLFLAAL